MREDLRPLFARELEAVFGNGADRRITVYDCFAGYGGDQERKVVLGVEVRAGDTFDSHIVKLGAVAEVSSDAEGWRSCAGGRYIGSRIFVRVRKIDLPALDGTARAAVIYENAYILFGLDQKTQSPEFLQDVATWAVLDDKPDPASVERVICQVYGDLHRWFYRTARSDATALADFYRGRLEKKTSGDSHPAHLLIFAHACDRQGTFVAGSKAARVRQRAGRAGRFLQRKGRRVSNHPAATRPVLSLIPREVPV